MRNNELMVEDYLTFTDVQNDSNCEKLKVVVIDGATNELLVSVDGDPTLDRIDIDDELCGIPITPEILEKNGFSQDPLNGHVFIFHEKSGEVIYYEYGSKYGLTIDNQLATIQDLKIKYVHEFQRALRCSGMFDLANNIKI